MVRSLFTLIVLISSLSCNTIIKNEIRPLNEQTDSIVLKEYVALEFINNYVIYCNNQINEVPLISWVGKQNNVSKEFKSELERIIVEANKRDPEMGLGFDPIFDAQDYPDKGFEFEELNNLKNIVVVKGIEWSSFKLHIKMVLRKGKYLVHGLGIINLSVDERVKR